MRQRDASVVGVVSPRAETPIVGGIEKSEPLVGLQLSSSRDSISSGKVTGQRDRRIMSRRRGQKGSVKAVGKKYVGRYWADVPGSTKRVRKAVEIGITCEMTRSEARRWLANYIEEQGVNSPAHLARSQSPTVGFGDAAELWAEAPTHRLWQTIVQKQHGLRTS